MMDGKTGDAKCDEWWHDILRKNWIGTTIWIVLTKWIGKLISYKMMY